VISGWSMSLSRLSRCEGEGASGRELEGWGLFNGDAATGV
jgi:hypothetical protein